MSSTSRIIPGTPSQPATFISDTSSIAVLRAGTFVEETANTQTVAVTPPPPVIASTTLTFLMMGV